MRKYTEKIDTVTVPMIPLRDTFAFPAMPINLELERSASKNAAEAAVQSDSIVFLVTQRDFEDEEPDADALYEVGCLARIRQVTRTEEDCLRISCEVLCRATLASVTKSNGHFVAKVISKTVTLDDLSSSIRAEALRLECASALEGILDYIPNAAKDAVKTAKSIENPGLLADFIAATIFIRSEDKQEILSIYEPLERLERAIVLLHGEEIIMKTEMSIHRKVREQLDDNQRDYYMREQLKILQNELGMDGDEEIDEYTAKVKNAELPDEVRERMEKEVSRLAKTAFGSPEAAVIRNYIDTVLDIPWGKKTKDVIDVARARKVLDADHDHLTKVKERICEYLAVKQLNPELRNQIICLVGPPGVGKTSLGASIARAMGRKYVRVSLGGVRDEADIRGHRKTYIGSMPGRIITALTQAKTLNPVILLDEVDKLCASVQGDPAAALLEVLDGEQNKAFCDHFIELPVDLSDCLFICTANELDPISRPLLDRMEVIELHTYTKTEKIAIARHHLIPKQIKRHGLNARKLKITDDALSALVDGYTRESGVRTLERYIAELCRKCASAIVSGKAKSLTVSAKNLEELLGPKKFIDDERDRRDLVGVVNGLAYTAVGGDLLKIETTVMDGTGKLELTGTLGDVMKESAKIAVSYARAHAAELSIDGEFYKNKDLHIHIPEGAVPKDGPSAGVTLLTSLVSALSGRAVRADIAMTGEITLTGRVLAIGGLREKTAAAYASGVRRVIIPAENERDLAELGEEVRAGLSFTPVRSVAEVLALALCPKDDRGEKAALSETRPAKKSASTNVPDAIVIPDTPKPGAPGAYCG